ncbi:hypothetical protein WJX75_007776 [Coccomyxa subellipsoidea]|uniref:HCNGP-domain-containing protein n=1 Tax=Coccomyxa subellipsoidea TaxID=248742 RepID=A0ABR2YK01_9CHLO
MSNEALTGLFGAYGSDDDDQSGSGDEGAATGTERPPGEVEPQVQKNVERLMRAKIETGKRITAELRRMRAYKNPDFLQKMVDFFGIEDIGSCYPKEVFDPKGFPKEDYYKALMQEWEAEENRKRIERNKVGPQFVKGPTEQAMTLPRGVAGTHAAAIAAKAREQASSSVGSMKRSKWDSAPKR